MLEKYVNTQFILGKLNNYFNRVTASCALPKTVEKNGLDLCVAAVTC